MSGSVNKVILIGNVGKEPEISTTHSGMKIVRFSLATNESWRNKETGEQERKTEWHRVVMFNENLANLVEQYVSKGSKIYIEGQLQNRKWTDANGIERFSTEVVVSRFKGELGLLDSRSDNVSNFPPNPAEDKGYDARNSDNSARSAAGATSQSSAAVSDANDELVDDQVPF